MPTQKQLEERLREIYRQIEVDNPFETFEPYSENYRGFEELAELYEARLRRLWVEHILRGNDEDLKRCLMAAIAEAIGKDLS